MALIRIGRFEIGSGSKNSELSAYEKDDAQYGAASQSASYRRARSDYSGRFGGIDGLNSQDEYADDGYAYDDGYDDQYADDDYSNDGYSDDETYDDGYADEDYAPYDDEYEDGRYSGRSRFEADPYDEDDYSDDGYGDGGDDYEPYDGGNASGGGVLDAVLDYVYSNDWVTYALLFLLPPLGIYLLWRRDRFERTIRLAVSVASAVWFVILIILLITWLSGGRPDSQRGSALPTQVPTLLTMQTVTPAPTDEPEPVNEPTATAVSGTGIATAAPGSLVWTSPTGTYYHSSDTCHGIGADETIARVTLENAQNRGKYACPICYGLETYYTNDTTPYYHLDSTCSGMTGAYQVTQEEAQAANKDACPVCVTKITDVLMTVVPGSTKLVDLSTVDESGIEVLFTPNGVNYHVKEHCRGMTGAKQASLKEALLAGKTACATCCAASGKIVYCTRTGTYYHANPTCSGMSGASDVTIAEALVLGKQECPTCKPNSANLASATQAPAATPEAREESEYYVYATKDGTYYHVKKNCSGMKNAKQVTLKSMLAEGRPACPECCAGASMAVYLTDGGTYYHSYATCSGMSGAKKRTLAEALANGYKRCPRCWGESTTGMST